MTRAAGPPADHAPAQRPLVLVVDDDEILRHLAKSTLDREFRVLTAVKSEEALRLLYQHRPDLILLDVTMPVMDGWETCRRIRQVSETPVIMLTARDANEDVVRGLDSGADDYVTKPFHSEQLGTRIRAVLRRQQRELTTSASASALPDLISFDDGNLVVDRVRRPAVVRGKEVELTTTEYKVLELLASHPGEIVSHNQILERAWGPECLGEHDYVKTYMAHLRRKIEANPSAPVYFHARRGMGYTLHPSGRRQSGERDRGLPGGGGGPPGTRTRGGGHRAGI